MWRYVCAIALLCAALADAHAYKRAEMSASPFVFTTRYGRSPPRMISSRTDRFFMTGRYGKRLDPAEKILGITENISNERKRVRDRGREEDRDILRKWRPRCDCTPYVKQLAMKHHYKRTPETLDHGLEDN